MVRGVNGISTIRGIGAIECMVPFRRYLSASWDRDDRGGERLVVRVDPSVAY